MLPPPLFKQVVIASHNAGKIKEFSALFQNLGIEVVSQASLGVPECPEPFSSFIENALAKARHCARVTGLPSLADDSGICVNALGGLPGVRSARWAGEPKSDVRNNEKLMLDIAPYADKSAYYYGVLVLVRHAEDPQPIIADGVWCGRLIDTPMGEGGFGYDPYFYLDAYQKTAAQIPPEEKNKISHRGLAMCALVEKMTRLIQSDVA